MGKYDAQPQSVVESILLKPEYANKNDEYGSTSTDVENLSGSLDDCDTSNADEKGTYWTASAGLTATIMGTVRLQFRLRGWVTLPHVAGGPVFAVINEGLWLATGVLCARVRGAHVRLFSRHHCTMWSWRTNVHARRADGKILWD